MIRVITDLIWFDSLLIRYDSIHYRYDSTPHWSDMIRFPTDLLTIRFATEPIWFKSVMIPYDSIPHWSVNDLIHYWTVMFQISTDPIRFEALLIRYGSTRYRSDAIPFATDPIIFNWLMIQSDTINFTTDPVWFDSLRIRHDSVQPFYDLIQAWFNDSVQVILSFPTRERSQDRWVAQHDELCFSCDVFPQEHDKLCFCLCLTNLSRESGKEKLVKERFFATENRNLFHGRSLKPSRRSFLFSCFTLPVV